jgi:myosin heavy subunit
LNETFKTNDRIE